MVRFGGADSWFGIGVDVSGSTAIVGSHGAAYLFEEQGPNWTQTAELTSSGGCFGERVAICGSRAVIADPYEGVDQGAVYVFKNADTGWQEDDKLLPEAPLDWCSYDYFGWGVAISGPVALVGARTLGDYGKAYVYEDSGTTWQQTARLTSDPLPDWFSDGVAISGSTV
ncbi:unnamed protein product, partial [marine sediment metagenome]